MLDNISQDLLSCLVIQLKGDYTSFSNLAKCNTNIFDKCFKYVQHTTRGKAKVTFFGPETSSGFYTTIDFTTKDDYKTFHYKTDQLIMIHGFTDKHFNQPRSYWCRHGLGYNKSEYIGPNSIPNTIYSCDIPKSIDIAPSVYWYTVISSNVNYYYNLGVTMMAFDGYHKLLQHRDGDHNYKSINITPRQALCFIDLFQKLVDTTKVIKIQTLVIPPTYGTFSITLISDPDIFLDLPSNWNSTLNELKVIYEKT
jgi:hypothetical protein